MADEEKTVSGLLTERVDKMEAGASSVAVNHDDELRNGQTGDEMDGVDDEEVAAEGGCEEDSLGEEGDGSCDSESEMGMTVQGQTVVSASKLKGAAECDDDDIDDIDGDDIDDVDDDDGRFSEEDDDKADSEDEMFGDDVDNLYDAYRSVLATDSTDLDPLDTSVIEDPYGDLPPICEDEELETGELSTSTGKATSGFEDSNAQTVVPVLMKNNPEDNISGEFGAEELRRQNVNGSVEHPEEDLDDGEGETGRVLDVSGGICVTEGRIAHMEGTGKDTAANAPGSGEGKIDGVGSEGGDEVDYTENDQVVRRSYDEEMEQAEDRIPADHLTEDSSNADDFASDMNDTSTVTDVMNDAPDVQVRSPDMDLGGIEPGTIVEDPAEGRVELPDVVPVLETSQCGSTEGEEVDEDMSVEPPGKSTQDPKVKVKYVERVTETVQIHEELVTVSCPPGRNIELPEDEVSGLEATNSAAADEPEDNLTTETFAQEDSDQGERQSEASLSDDGEVASTHETGLHSETKYDSGCESEKTLETMTCQTGDDRSCEGSSCAEDELNDDNVTPSKEYPEFIDLCEEKLKVHYVSCYAKEAPVDWFHTPKKPSHRIFTNINLMERNHSRHDQLLTFDLLNFKPCLRILIEGHAGMGKSTLVHRIAYDYGLGMLAPLKQFKLVFVLDVLKWSRDQELHDVILEQVVQADAWGIEADDVFKWMQDNAEEVIFFIDGLDEHPGFSANHTLLSLARGELYTNSTVVFTSQPNHVFEIGDCCHKFYVMQKFTERQVVEFIGNFLEDENETKKLKDCVFSGRNITDFYKTPLHLALLCTLYQNSAVADSQVLPSTLTALFDKVFVYTLRQLVADRRVDAQKELELSMFEDMAFVLTRLALSWLQADSVSLSKHQLASDHEIDDDLLDEFIQYGLLEKVVCRDAYFFPCKLFQEFLAAKFIAIEYFSAANSGQIGIIQDMKHVLELFELCWSCCDDGYKYENVCIFTSGLLKHDYNCFVEALCKQYNEAPNDSAREVFINVVCACIGENANNRGFISLVVDSLAPKGDLSLDFSTDSIDGPHLFGVSHMLAADKLPKLTLVDYNPNDIDALQSVASALAETDRLRSLEIDFTNLDPTVNGMPKMKDGTEDFTLLKHFVKSISANTSLRDISLQLGVDRMSLQGVEAISGLFLNMSSDLKSLGVHVHFDNTTSTYFKDCPRIKDSSIQLYENLNILISRFSVFLQNNSMLEKLELNGCFLHRDALPELKDSIIGHSSLKAISLAGQGEGAPLHREGANALAEILLKKKFDEVAIDLNSFLAKEPGKYTLGDSRMKYERVQFDNELIVAKLLKAMQANGTVKRVKFSCRQIDCDLLDHVADFLEDCMSLTSLEISCEEMDDLFMMFLGCGILCSPTLDSLTLHGSFDSGGATFLLVQSCMMSQSLKSVTLSGSFSLSCIDWLAVSLPNLNIQCAHPLTLTLQGHLEDGDSESALDSVEQLKDCVLPLDLLLETDFK